MSVLMRYPILLLTSSFVVSIKNPLKRKAHAIILPDFWQFLKHMRKCWNEIMSFIIRFKKKKKVNKKMTPRWQIELPAAIAANEKLWDCI